MSLADAVVAESSGTYTVTRTVRATYGSDGRAVPGATSTLSVTASVQPTTGRDLKRLPEGMRTREVLTVFTPTLLRTLSATTQPDSIQISGEAWQVQNVEDWSTLGGYYKALVIKADA